MTATETKKKSAQDQCIENHDGKWLVIAGPGTGKTYTVSHRINAMLKGDENHEPIPPESILCLTFSDTAAREMRQEIGEERPVDVFTYHSFCKTIIDEYPDEFELKNPIVITDDSKRSLVTECIDDMMSKPETKLIAYNNEKGNPYAFMTDILDGIRNIKMDRYSHDSFINNLNNHIAWKPHLKELKEERADEEGILEKIKAEIAEKMPKYAARVYEKIESGTPLTAKDTADLDKYEKKRDEDINKKFEKRKSDLDEEIEKLENSIKKMEELWSLYEKYETLRKDLNYIDFNDMINMVLDKFEDKSSNLLQKVAQHYDYVIVDEYQDTNTAQNDIVFNLAKYCHNIFVVGDDDQIIYTFQGAHLDTIKKFREKLEEDNPIEAINVKCFTDNYRSTQPILDVSKAIAELQDDMFYEFMAGKDSCPIQDYYKDKVDNNEKIKLRFLSQTAIKDDNGEIINKHLVSQNDRLKDLTDPVEFFTFTQKDDERDYIVKEIIKIKEEIDEFNEKEIKRAEKKKETPNLRKYSDIAILTFKNKELTEFEQYLKANNIPIEITGGKNIFDINSVNVLISYLQFLTNPERYYDKILSYLLLEPMNISERDYMEICRLKTHYKTLFENIKSYVDKKEVKTKKDEKEKDNLKMFLATYTYLRDYVTCENYKTSLLEIGNRTGIFDYYFNKDIINKVENIKGIKKLLEMADAYFEVNTDEKKSFTMFVEYLSKMLESGTEIKLDKENKPTNAIQLSTYHSSKGRQFEYVFMPNLTAGKWDEVSKDGMYDIPLNPIEGQTFEEFLDTHYQGQYLDNIKLLYVGMTRTKRKLMLSFTENSSAKAYGKLSWFISKLLDNKELTEGENPKLLVQPKIEELEVDFNVPEPVHKQEEFNRYIEPSIPNKFSVSALNTYRDCPKQYFYQRILKMKVKSGSQDDMNYGTAVHAAFQEAIKYVMNNKKYPDREYVKGIFNDALSELEFTNPENTKASAEEKIFGENGYYEKYFTKLVDPEKIPKNAVFEENPVLNNEPDGKRIYAEYKLNYEINMPDELKLSCDNENSKIIYEGFVDRIDKDDDGKYIIYDYKTKESCDDIKPSENYFYQMVFYKYVLELQNPKIEVKEAYFLLPLEKHGNHQIGVHQKFVKEYVTQPSEDIFKQKTDELEDAIKNIRKMEFEKPDRPNCNWCPYKFICRHKLT